MIFLPLLPVLFAAGQPPLEPLTSRITPRVIEVTAFYDGADVRVEGEAASQSQIVVAIVGPDREERFKTRARVGPLWLSGEAVRISGVPSLFLRFSSAPVAASVTAEDTARARLDEPSAVARMRIEPPREGESGAAIRSNYLALKASESIYNFGNGGIALTRFADCQQYRLAFRWPKRAPPATYEVRVFEIQDGRVVRETSSWLPVVRAGFPAWLADWAEHRPSLYGAVAVLIAALAGFGIDFVTTCVFGKKHRVAH